MNRREHFLFDVPVKSLFHLIAALLVTVTATASPAAIRWSQLAPLPDPLGVAGPFAGVSGGVLLVAGGANFPEKMPWAGGRKIWHDTSFVLEEPDGRWKIAGRIPHPRGYGVSVSHQDAVICVGGSDANRHYADAFRLQWQAGKLSVKTLPALPMPLANMSGAVVANILYLAGGSESPGEQSATNRFLALDLDADRSAWRELDRVPGKPRLLAAAASHNGAFYLLGGVALEPNADGKNARVYLREALRYRPGEGWTRLADLPRPSVAAPSPAPVLDGRILLLAGDDGSRAGFTPPDQHPGFPKTILAYDPALNHWSEAGELPAPRATAPCVAWRGMFVVPSGEVRPGVRSPEVWAWRDTEK